MMTFGLGCSRKGLNLSYRPQARRSHPWCTYACCTINCENFIHVDISSFVCAHEIGKTSVISTLFSVKKCSSELTVMCIKWMHPPGGSGRGDSMLKLGFHYVSLTLIHFSHRIGIVVHSFHSIKTFTMLTGPWCADINSFKRGRGIAVWIHVILQYSQLCILRIPI